MRSVSMFVCVGVVAAATACVAIAADENAPAPQSLTELDQRLAKAFADHGVPGASVAVIENNQIVFAKGYGVADVAAKTPVTPETVFRAGSISKNIVGIAVMMLVEEGKLGLNAKLADLAPEIRFTNAWEASDPVRLAHLMEHTTGFDDIRFSQYLLDGNDMPLRQATELYGPYVSRWKPGTYPSYSNAPPVIAGYIVERVSGTSWAEFTRTRIFEPLGMTSAQWTKSAGAETRLAKSYRSDGVTEEPYFDIPGKPAGSLNVTATDLAKLALMLNGRGTLNGMTLLTPASVERIETPGTTLASRLGLKHGYGLGNYVTPREKGVFHGHDGGIDGFLATYLYEPRFGAGLVVMINAANGKALREVDTIVGYLERSWPKAAVPKPAPPQQNTEELAGVYQSTTPRQQMLAPIAALFEWTGVGSKEGRLVIDDKERLHLGSGIYQRVDRSAPSVVFAPAAGGPLMLTAFGASRLVPAWEVAVKAVYAISYAVAMLLSAVFLFVWTVAWIGGRLRGRGGALVRLVPSVAIFVPVVFLAAFVAAIAEPSMGALVTVGTPSTTAQIIYGLSLAIPATGALSLLIALAAPYATPFFVRMFAVLNSALVLGAAAFLWHYEWIGLKTWV